MYANLESPRFFEQTAEKKKWVALAGVLWPGALLSQKKLLWAWKGSGGVLWRMLWRGVLPSRMLWRGALPFVETPHYGADGPDKPYGPYKPYELGSFVPEAYVSHGCLQALP